MKPMADSAMVSDSGAKPVSDSGRTSGGPKVANMVRMRAFQERSTVPALRRTSVNATTSASLASSSRPVTWPVSAQSFAMRIDIDENSARMKILPARSP